MVHKSVLLGLPADLLRRLDGHAAAIAATSRPNKLRWLQTPAGQAALREAAALSAAAAVVARHVDNAYKAAVGPITRGRPELQSARIEVIRRALDAFERTLPLRRQA